MNKIKGLLLKDFLELKSYKKSIMLSILIYIFIIIINKDSSDMFNLVNAMFMFLFSVYAIATFNYEERTNADRYFLTFPLTRKDIVKSKYILVIISIFLGLILGTLIGVILYLFGIVKSINISDYISSTLGVIYVLSILHSIQLPCIYKFGAEKGRNQIYIILMAIIAIIGCFMMILPKPDFSFLDQIEKNLTIILLCLSIFNYFISYKISYKIFSKKEL